MKSNATSAAQLRTDASAQNWASRDGYIHVLKAGETLRTVAAQYGVDPQALLAANPQLRGVQLREGIAINIPVSRPSGAASTTDISPRSFDLPRTTTSRTQPLSGLQSPTVGGISTQQPYASASRSYYADPNNKAPAPQVINWPENAIGLSSGRKGPGVETLQRALCRIGYSVTVDGDFGSGTDAAVRHFQHLVGLNPDGVVGNDTFSALRNAVGAVTQPTQALVDISREQFSTVEERNAYDVMVVLAYDDPKSLRELLRVTRQPQGVPLRVTAEAVTAFAYAAADIGFPLSDSALAPLAPLRSTDRASFNTSEALMDFMLPKFRGSGYADTTSYDALIAQTARQNGVEPELVKAVIAVESRFKPGAVSGVGARGLMQVMPDTGDFVGVPNSGASVERNVLAGVRYMKYLLNRFNGDVVNMAAGYNAGDGRVIRNGGVPQIQETYDYVRRILAHYAYYKMHPVRA